MFKVGEQVIFLGEYNAGQIVTITHPPDAGGHYRVTNSNIEKDWSTNYIYVNPEDIRKLTKLDKVLL